MKKILCMFLVAMFATTASAQFRIGVKGGVNVTQLSAKLGDYGSKSNNNAGFYIGPTAKFNTPLGIGADLSALYSQSQFKSVLIDLDNDGQVEETTVKQQYIAIPINLRYTFGLGESANLFLFVGPQFNFNVGKKTVDVIKNVAEWDNTASQVCINAGVGVTVLKHVQVSVNFNHPFKNSTELQDSQTGESYGSVTANLWQVGLAWWF